LTAFAPCPVGGTLVGGAVRDALLGRPSADTDWLVADPQASARQLAAALEGSAFPLAEARGAYRVVAGNRTFDLSPLTGSLADNLAARDYTVNAMAVTPDGTLIDPFEGRRDLARKQLRMLSPTALTADPLRPLRGVRLAVELGFGLEPATRQVITSHAVAQVRGAASLPAWERVTEELGRIVMSARAADGVALLATLGLLETYLPELAQTCGVEQLGGRYSEPCGFHHLDVFEHSVEALRQLLVRFPEADSSLRWAALLHDIGKPATKSYDEAGRYYHFYGHDRLGSRLAQAALARLRAPHEVALRVAKLVRYHMLPLPKGERAARRFAHRRRDILPDLLKLMIADREAARGPLSSDRAREAYRLALGRVLAIMAEPQPPLLDGHEVMALLNLKPGPQVGQAMRFIQEAQAVGDVRTREDAEAALRRYAEAQGFAQPEGAQARRGRL